MEAVCEVEDEGTKLGFSESEFLFTAIQGHFDRNTKYAQT